MPAGEPAWWSMAKMIPNDHEFSTFELHDRPRDSFIERLRRVFTSGDAAESEARERAEQEARAEHAEREWQRGIEETRRQQEAASLGATMAAAFTERMAEHEQARYRNQVAQAMQGTSIPSGQQARTRLAQQQAAALSQLMNANAGTVRNWSRLAEVPGALMISRDAASGEAVLHDPNRDVILHPLPIEVSSDLGRQRYELVDRILREMMIPAEQMGQAVYWQGQPLRERLTEMQLEELRRLWQQHLSSTTLELITTNTGSSNIPIYPPGGVVDEDIEHLEPAPQVGRVITLDD